MADAFRSFDPETLGHQSQPKACEACYARKVKCDIGRGQDVCRNCSKHGLECHSRSRKRKNGAPEQVLSQTNADSSKDDSSSLTNTGRKRSRADVDNARMEDAGPSTAIRLSRRSTRVEDDDDLSAPLLFIGPQTNLANSPTTTVDALPASVDEFHNSSYISRAAVLGADFPDIDHSHIDSTQKRHKLSAVEMKVLELYGAFDLPELPLRQSLIEAYREKIWTWMPVVDLHGRLSGVSPNEISLLPLQAVLLAGALMRPDICSKAMCDTLYYKVKSLIHSGYERNPLNLLAALCLIQYYTPTAPKDVSVDTPRFWWSCALGIAQQIGLHRQPLRQDKDYGLRRRIWWTLYVRDSLMSSAHGRPRLLRLADSTMEPPAAEDFGHSDELGPRIFIAYVHITEIMCDLCGLLVNNNVLTLEHRAHIEQRLLELIRGLPQRLQLYDAGGLPNSFNFELSQLHIPLLTTLIILYRPRSVHALDTSNAASIAASHLNFRIFEAIQLREQTRYLGSAFSWYLLVTAIPHLSSLKIPALHKGAETALDSIEGVLATLGSVRPAATTNLKNVRAIRKVISIKGGESMNMEANVQDRRFENPYHQDHVRELLGFYGPQALRNLDAVFNAIGSAHPSLGPQEAITVGVPDLNGMTPTLAMSNYQDEPSSLMNGGFELDTNFDMNLDSLFGTHFQENMWMRDWIDHLQPFSDG